MTSESLLDDLRAAQTHIASAHVVLLEREDEGAKADEAQAIVALLETLVVALEEEVVPQ